MNKRFLQPSAKLVGGFFAAAFALLAASAVALNIGGPDYAVPGYLSLLFGLLILFMALAQFVVRQLNLKYGPPED